MVYSCPWVLGLVRLDYSFFIGFCLCRCRPYLPGCGYVIWVGAFWYCCFIRFFDHGLGLFWIRVFFAAFCCEYFMPMPFASVRF